MAAKDEPCKQCGLFDRYVKGKFSYCRPCHNEAYKRYIQRKAEGVSVEPIKPPANLLSDLLKRPGLSTRCPKGHSLTGDNVRITAQNKGAHLERRCRTCDRNRRRVDYGLAPEPEPRKLADLLDD